MEGLDSSIVIDPVRMHMTLGVMALEVDDVGTSSRRGKTPASALALLASLSPQISQILNGDKGVKVPLEVVDVLKTEKIRQGGPRDNENIGAGVLFLGPREITTNTMDGERRKLMDVCGTHQILWFHGLKSHPFILRIYQPVIQRRRLHH